MSDVFISYSRQDTDFVRRLNDALASTERDAWVDWEDIPLTADWWQEIQTGIEAAHTFIFVISPGSLSSPICHMEIAHARHNNKRIVPVVREAVDEAGALAELATRSLDDLTEQRLVGQDLLAIGRTNWHVLSRHNWLFFRDSDDFDTAFGDLLNAIDTDLDHVREHTRLLIRALEWQDNAHESSYLMDGIEIARAESWLTTGVGREPLPTELHAEYIRASRQKANRRQRNLLVGISAALIVALSLAALAFVLFQQSEDRLQQREIAQATSNQRATEVALQVTEVEIQRVAAEENAATATNALGISDQRGTEVALQVTAVEEQRIAAENNAATATNALGVSDQRGTEVALQVTAVEEQRIAAENNAATATSALGVSDQRGTEVALQVTAVEIQRVAAEENAATATVAQGEALDFAATSEANLLQAWRTQSLFLADLANQELDSGSPQNALLLGRESLEHYPQVYNSASAQVLLSALSNIAQETTYVQHDVSEFGVQGAAWNPDETQLLTWSNDGTARLWDPDTGAALLTLPHDDSVNGALWNANGSEIFTYASDGAARLWDATNGHLLFTFQHDGYINSAVWNQQETQVLTRSFDGTTRVWDTITGEQLLVLRHEDWVNNAIWNAAETQILTASNDNTAVVWDAQTGTLLRTLTHESSVGGAVWDPTESRILTWSNRNVYIWAEDQTPLHLIAASSVRDAVWDPGGSRLLTRSTDEVQVWDASSGALLVTLTHNFPGDEVPDTRTVESLLTARIDQVTGAQWNQTGTRIMSRYGRAVHVWDSTSGERLLTMRHDNYVNGAIWDGAETAILTWSDDNTARAWRARDGQLLLTMRHNGPVKGARWNDNESQLLTWGGDHSARIWTIGRTRARLNLWHPSTGQNFGRNTDFGAAWSPGEDRIVTWSGDGTARVWSAAVARNLFSVQHEAVVEGAAFSPDDTRLVTWDSAGNVWLWDADNPAERLATQPLVDLSPGGGGFNTSAIWNQAGTQILTWADSAYIKDAQTGATLASMPHDGTIWGAAWSPNEGRVLTWSADDTARIWDANTGDLLMTLRHSPSERGVRGARWNAAANRVLSHTEGGDVVLWDATTGEALFTLPHANRLFSVLWSPDEARLLTRADNDNKVRVWDSKNGDLLQTLQNPQAEFELSGGRWSHDGQHILTWTPRLNNGEIQMWDSQSGTLVLTLPHIDGAQGASWSHDDQHILAWFADGVVRIWDATTGELTLDLQHNSTIIGAAWNSAETQLLVWEMGSRAYRWMVTVDDLLAVADDYIIRALSSTERQQFFLPPVTTIPVTPAPTALLERPTPIPTPTLAPAFTIDNHPAAIIDQLAQSGILPAASGFLAADLMDVYEVDLSEDDNVTTWVNLDGTVADFVMSATVVHETNAPESDDACGFILRQVDEDNLYKIELDVKGNIWFSILVDNAWDSNQLGDQVAPRIPPGTPYSLVLASVEDTFTLLVNGTPYATFVDSRFASGSLAVSALTLEDSDENRCLFSDIWIWDLNATEALPTPTPTAAPIREAQAQIGVNPGELVVGSGAIWTYDGLAGEVLTIQVNAAKPANDADNTVREAEGLLDTLVVVRAPDGQIIAEADDIDPGVITDSRIEGLTLPVNGTYEIEIRSWENLSGGEYTLTIESNR